MLKWSIELCGYDLTFVPRTAIKAQALADFIVETSFSEKDVGASESAEIPNQQTSFDEVPRSKVWTLMVDGAVNSQGAGVGIILSSPSKHVEKRSVRLEFTFSNNQAEYEALIISLLWAQEIGIQFLEAYSDSQVVVGQMNNEYAVNSDNLRKYASTAQKIATKFINFRLMKICRNENTEADKLAKHASGDEVGEEIVQVEVHTSPIFSVHIFTIDTSPVTWIDEFTQYIETSTLPGDPIKARQIHRQSTRYLLHNGILYRRSFSKPLLRCVSPSMVIAILEEFHKGICDGHPGARTLSKRVFTQGYYWPTLRKDAQEFVQKCHSCQIYGDVPCLPSIGQTLVVTSWSFDMWGIDSMGKFPRGKSGFEYLVMAVDYFSKWIKAKPLVHPTELNVSSFFHDYVLCRFGVPQTVVSDHGTQFSKHFTSECERLHIRHWKSSVAHPQGNGQAKAANKMVMSALKKNLVGKSNKWVEELPAALWAVRTMLRGPTGETPFALIYGSEAVSPAELTLPTARVDMFNQDQNPNLRTTDLDFLEERRIAARLKSEDYKRKTKKFHDKRIVCRPLKIGDLVLRKIEVTHRQDKANKLTPNWEGPYIIRAEVRPGTYKLANQDGVSFPNPWHSDHLKKYYV